MVLEFIMLGCYALIGTWWSECLRQEQSRCVFGERSNYISKHVLSRCCVVQQHWLGVSTCLLMRVSIWFYHDSIADHAYFNLVVIKGTQVYDSSKGSFVDLSVLDVLQVFGRAGRPGLETSGEGYILTTEDKLTHYLDAVTSQVCHDRSYSRGIFVYWRSSVRRIPLNPSSWIALKY